MDGVKQQDSTTQNDSTLGFKWIKQYRTKHCVVIYSQYIMIILILLEITLNCV